MKNRKHLTDAEKVTLLEYIKSNGMPDWAETKATQHLVLQKLCGWTEERAKAAYVSAVACGWMEAA